MSTTGRRVLSFIFAILIGLVLVGLGFVLGRNSLAFANLVPYGRFRPGLLGFGVGGFFAPILTILFWAVVIGLIVWLVSGLVSGRRAANLPASTTPPVESALDILQKRYARGEITKAEYEELRRDLGT